jgi:hypothetical protein
MLVNFYYRPTESGKDASGIPVYTDKVFVQITMDALTTVDRPAEENDFERFPEHYAHFLKSTAKYEPIEGKIPLEMWPISSPAETMNFKARGIRTVEDLAKVSASTAKNWPGSATSLIELAKQYMQNAGNGTAIVEELNLLKSTMTDLKEQLATVLAENKMLKTRKVEDA